MPTIKDKEDAIHEEFKKRIFYNKDGLIFMGDQKDPEIFSREPGKEESLWNASKLKILFVLKESYGNIEDQDIREWMPHKHTGRMDNNLCRLLYGLYKFDEKTLSYPEFDDLQMDKVREYVAGISYARINVKKTDGTSSSNNKQICAYFIRDFDLIKKQIHLLEPNIIIFGGILSKNDKVRDMVKKEFGCFVEDKDTWITTNNKRDRAIFDSYHLNPKGTIKDIDFYSSFMDSYKTYIKERQEI